MIPSEYIELARKLETLDLQHREYIRIRKEAYSHCALAPAGSVIMVVGPTRVGKSRICDYVARTIVKSPLSDSPDRIPLIRVEATNANSGFFSMKHFTIRALSEIHHPLVRDLGSFDDALRGSPRLRHTETTLRIALERGLIARGTKYLLVDEAHHLLRIRRDGRSGEILDSLKCLANTNQLVLVLFGGYELLTVGLSSAHLNGRLRILHFPRYKPVEADYLEFARVLASLDSVLPLARGFSLLSQKDFIYGGTMGTVGLVMSWVHAATASMVAADRRLLVFDDFRKTRFSKQLELIQADIELGERSLAPMSVSAPPDGRKSDAQRPPAKAFSRKPVRDKVGES